MFKNPLVILGIIVVLALVAGFMYKKSKKDTTVPSGLIKQPPYNSDLVNAPMEGTIANKNTPLAAMGIRSGCSKCNR